MAPLLNVWRRSAFLNPVRETNLILRYVTGMYVIDSSVVEHLMRVMRRARENPVFKEAWRSYEEFIERFPFRRRPEKIEELTPEDVYNPGADKPRRDFFYYVEKKLKPLGHITVYNDYAWRRAREDLATFKEPLKTLVDDDERICRKIDSWDRLKGFGGDNHYAKKLLFLYYPLISLTALSNNGFSVS